jgi:hypothetical protein
MFMARPINLKTEVWDRIDEYLNKKADEDRNFKPNRSLFLEEAAIFYLDSLDKPAEEESTEEESSDDSFDFGSSDDDSSDESSDEASSDEESSSDDSTEASSDDEFNFDFDSDDKEEES